MQEKIIKALQSAQFLDQELRDIYKASIDKNDALLVLMGQLMNESSKIVTILSQLEKV